VLPHGAGGILVVTVAAVGDVVPPRSRGRYQGYFGGVFGVATVVGPLLGGFFVDTLAWRWIFYVDIPIGIVALAVIASVFQARADRIAHRIDYLRAVLLGSGLAAVVLYTSEGGTTHPWGSAPWWRCSGRALSCRPASCGRRRGRRSPACDPARGRGRSLSPAQTVTWNPAAKFRATPNIRYISHRPVTTCTRPRTRSKTRTPTATKKSDT
jgi:Major Facilitator Superfamily